MSQRQTVHWYPAALHVILWVRVQRSNPSPAQLDPRGMLGDFEHSRTCPEPASHVPRHREPFLGTCSYCRSIASLAMCIALRAAGIRGRHELLTAFNPPSTRTAPRAESRRPALVCFLRRLDEVPEWLREVLQEYPSPPPPRYPGAGPAARQLQPALASPGPALPPSPPPPPPTASADPISPRPSVVTPFRVAAPAHAPLPAADPALWPRDFPRTYGPSDAAAGLPQPDWGRASWHVTGDAPGVAR